MTDKQIIARLKTDLDFERTKRKSLQVDLKVKEQECNKLKRVLARIGNIVELFCNTY